MTIEELRRRYRTQPFEPFLLRTADGREYDVRHPELLAISPAGRTIAVMLPDGSTEVVNLLLVASIHLGNGHRRRRRA